MTEPPLPELTGDPSEQLTDAALQKRRENVALGFALLSPILWLLAVVLLLGGTSIKALNLGNKATQLMLGTFTVGVILSEVVAFILGLRIWRSAGGVIVLFCSLLLGAFFAFLIYVAITMHT